jgi:hypothetical protein
MITHAAGCSSPSAKFLLGVEASDSAVELRALFGIEPARWYPFRQPIVVDPAAPALLQEMGVVSTDQGQIFEIGAAAQDPIQDVMSITRLRWMITSGEGTSAFPSDQRHGLTTGRDPSGSAQGEWDSGAVDDGGPDLSLISDPQQLIGAELAAVAGFSDPSPGQQILNLHGDDDRCRGATSSWPGQPAATTVRRHLLSTNPPPQIC